MNEGGKECYFVLFIDLQLETDKCDGDPFALDEGKDNKETAISKKIPNK